MSIDLNFIVNEMDAGREDVGLDRPYFDKNGHKCVTLPTGEIVQRKNAMGETICNEAGQPLDFQVKKSFRQSELRNRGIDREIWNATALRKDEWLSLDQRVIKVFRERLRAWSDLVSANVRNIDGMAQMNVEHETVSDSGSAQVDMYGLAQGQDDSPLFQLESTPLPITSSTFFIAERILKQSRKTSTPMDMLKGENAARKVAESIEQTLINGTDGITYGNAAAYGRTPTVWGYTNFPDRVQKTDMTAPTGSNGVTIFQDWLDLVEAMRVETDGTKNNFHGPFMAYVSSNYSRYLNDFLDSSDTAAGLLKTKLMEIDQIMDIRPLDYLTTDNTVVLVQMTSDVARAINGMSLNTVQWNPEPGRFNFRVRGIQVPELFADYNGRCGIGVGTTS